MKITVSMWIRWFLTLALIVLLWQHEWAIKLSLTMLIIVNEIAAIVAIPKD